MPRTRWLQRSVVGLVASSQLLGCTSWHVETLSPADLIASKEPTAIRVQYADSTSEVLYEPEVQGDMLVGRRQSNGKQSDHAVALADVKRTATRRLDAGRTTALGLAMGAVVGVFVGLANMQGPFDNWGQ